MRMRADRMAQPREHASAPVVAVMMVMTVLMAVFMIVLITVLMTVRMMGVAVGVIVARVAYGVHKLQHARTNALQHINK